MMRFKNLHDIDTFACNGDEVFLSGKDEEGEPFTIVVNAYEFLQWIDIDYIREKLIENIRDKNKYCKS